MDSLDPCTAQEAYLGQSGSGCTVLCLCSSMAPQARLALALCALLLVPAGVVRRAEAASYNVGNSAGWDLSADLPSWAQGKTFNVGDVQVFQYSKYHTLDEVDEAGFKNCSAADAVLSRSDGNTTAPLAAPGDRYFICGNQLHCLGGMKLHVVVSQPAGGAPSAVGEPQSPPEAGTGAALAPSTDDAGIPWLVLGGSHRGTVGAGPMLVTCLLGAAALLV